MVSNGSTTTYMAHAAYVMLAFCSANMSHQLLTCLLLIIFLHVVFKDRLSVLVIHISFSG